MDQPFMEHPVGDFKNAVEAMSDAIARLRKLAVWPAAIVFSAQGYGAKPESYQFAEVRLEGSRLSVEGGPFDLSNASQARFCRPHCDRRPGARILRRGRDAASGGGDHRCHLQAQIWNPALS